MKTVALGTISDSVMGQAPPSSACNTLGEGYPFVKAGEFGTERPIIREWTTKPLKKAKSTDVLLCVVGATAGKLNLGVDCAIGRSVAAIRPKPGALDQKYLYYYLQSWTEKLRVGSQGSAQGVITREMIARLEIPLPPLETQKHIARVLEQADQLRKQAQQMESELNQLAQSLFLEMFGSYFYDEGIFDAHAKQICKLVTIIDYRGKTPEKTESGVPLITAKNVKQGYINQEPREFIAEETYDVWMSRGYPEANDVLFTTEAPLGNVAKLGHYEKVVIGQRLLDLRCGDKLVPDYLVFALQNEVIQQAILSRSTGSTVKGIRSKEFEKISIPVPPLDMQIRFSECIAQLEQIKMMQSEKSQQIDSMFESAMQRAFKGELTTPGSKAA